MVLLTAGIRTETVVRLRAATVTDTYSQDPWETPSELSIRTLAPAEPRPSGEPVQDARNAVSSGWTVYFPEGVDITSADRLRIRGKEYQVLGEPAVWHGAGVVVQCDRTVG